jgi:hypothetical protein
MKNDVKLKKKLYWAMKTGIKKHSLKQWLRFITLTSSEQSPKDIRKSFKKLVYELRRDGKKIEYLAVVTDEGLGVIHAIYFGSYLKREYLIGKWKVIHGAWNIDIRAVENKDSGNFQKYLFQNYIKNQKGMVSVFWSRQWMWSGALKEWTKLKKTTSGGMVVILYEWDKIIEDRKTTQVNIE